MPELPPIRKLEGIHLLHGPEPPLLWGRGSDSINYPTSLESLQSLDPFQVIVSHSNTPGCDLVQGRLEQYYQSTQKRPDVPGRCLDLIRPPVIWKSRQGDVVKLLPVPSWDPLGEKYHNQREVSRRAAGRRMHSVLSEVLIGRLASNYNQEDTKVLAFKHILFERFDSVERIWLRMDKACGDAEVFLRDTILGGWFGDWPNSNSCQSDPIYFSTNQPAIASLINLLSSQYPPHQAIIAAKGKPLHAKDKSFQLARVIFKVWLDMIKGVEWLHSQNIVHRDLKPVNVLVHLKDDGFYSTICDFGESIILNDLNLTLGTNGTAAYRPYEWRAYPAYLASQTELPAIALSFIRMVGQVYWQSARRMDKLRVESEYQYSNDSCSLSTFWVTRIRADSIQQRIPQDFSFHILMGNHLANSLHLSHEDYFILWSLLVECCRLDPLTRPTVAQLRQRLEYVLRDHDVDNVTWKANSMTTL